MEGRLEDTKKKYGSGMVVGSAPPGALGLPDRVIDQLAAGDPSGNNKYLMWMAREAHEAMYVASRKGDVAHFMPQRTPETIIQYVQDFHKAQQRLDKKDIMAYDEAEDVRDAVAALGVSKTQAKKKTKLEGADRLYEDENFLLLHPKNKDAVCMYGANTQWCITMRQHTHYENYIEEGKIFYFLLPKNPGLGGRMEKIAFVFDDAGDLEDMFDEEDENIDEDDATALIDRSLGGDSGEDDSRYYHKFVDLMSEDVHDRIADSEKAKKEAEEREVESNVEEVTEATEQFNRDNNIFYAYADSDPYGWDGENAYYSVSVGAEIEFPESLMEFVDDDDLRKVFALVTDITIWSHNIESRGDAVRFSVEDSDLTSSDHDHVISSLDYYDKSDLTEQDFINVLEALLIEREDIDIGVKDLEGKLQNFDVSLYEATSSNDDEDPNSVMSKLSLVTDGRELLQSWSFEYRDSAKGRAAIQNLFEKVFVRAVKGVYASRHNQLGLPGISTRSPGKGGQAELPGIHQDFEMDIDRILGSAQAQVGVEFDKWESDPNKSWRDRSGGYTVVAAYVQTRNDDDDYPQVVKFLQFIDQNADEIREDFRRILVSSLE